jgi:hypothetical protein
MGVEQNLHRRASKAWASSTESSGSIANTPDPRNFSQGRWLGEVLPFSRRNGQFQPQGTADHLGQHGLDRVVRFPSSLGSGSGRSRICRDGMVELIHTDRAPSGQRRRLVLGGT